MEKCEPAIRGDSKQCWSTFERRTAFIPENIEFHDISGKIADDHVNNLHLIFVFGVTWAICENTH
jgi:hypothetical protein